MIPEMPFPLAGETAAIRDALAIAFDSLARDQHELDGKIAAIRGVEPDNWLPDYENALARLRKQRVEILTRKMALRERLAEYYAAAGIDLAVACDTAHEKHERAQEQVRGLLISIGYLDGPLPGTDVPSIRPETIRLHPTVFAAKIASDSLCQFDSIGDWQRQNTAAQATCRRQLEELQRLAVAGLV